MTITVVFDPPLPSDSPSTFNTKAFTLLGDLNTWSTQANAMPASFASSVSTALASPPAIGGTTPNAVTATTVSVKSGTLGYGAGAGGTVTQATSKATPVTINKASGQVTMHNAALAGGTSASFYISNSLATAANGVVTTFVSGGAIDYSKYLITAEAAAGKIYINVRNLTGTSYAEALVFTYQLITGATS